MGWFVRGQGRDKSRPTEKGAGLARGQGRDKSRPTEKGAGLAQDLPLPPRGGFLQPS